MSELPDKRELEPGQIWRAIAPERNDVPDEAPPCDEPGCQRLGVIVQTVTTREWTRVWHWCAFHDPEDV